MFLDPPPLVRGSWSQKSPENRELGKIQIFRKLTPQSGLSQYVICSVYYVDVGIEVFQRQARTGTKYRDSV